MYPESKNEARIIKESRILPMKTKLTILAGIFVVVTVVGVSGWLYLTKQPIVLPESSYGLNTAQLDDPTPYGELLLSTEITDEEITEQQTIQYAFSDDRFSTVSRESGVESFKSGDYLATLELVASTTTAPEDVVITIQNLSTGDIARVATDNQYYESDITVSETGKYIAYGFQINESAQGLSVMDSNVALYYIQSGETYTIAAAAKPIFFKNGTKLLYLGNNGIYEFDIETKTSQLVYATTPNRLLADDFTVSLDSQYLVMTFAEFSLISVAVNTSDTITEFTELGAVVGTGGVYSNPTIASDGRMYAVQVAGSGNTHIIEIRSLRNDAVLKSILLTDAGQNPELKFWNVPGTKLMGESLELLTNSIE